MIIEGHRGVAGLEPENTLRSFQKAIELGVDCVECDLHLTKDRHLVVIHDSSVDRTTNGQGLVEEFTLADIKKLDAGKGEKIPALQEVLDLIIFNVGGGDGMFDLQALRKLKEIQGLNPTLSVLFGFGKLPENVCKSTIDSGVRIIGVELHSLTPEFVKEAHKYDLEVRTWNPDTLKEMQRVMDMGVDGICTDRPDILLRFLGRG
jgi:glycerophosphoryl diester phosphodiesterase